MNYDCTKLSSVLEVERTSPKSWDIKSIFDPIFSRPRYVPENAYAKEVRLAAIEGRDPKSRCEIESYWEFESEFQK